MSQPVASTSPTRGHVVIAFASVYLFWGGTYLGIRFAIETMPPFLMAGVRFLIAGSILYVWMRRTGAPRPTRIQWRDTAIIGGLLLLGGNGGVTWAEQRVPSSLAALMVGAIPLWMVLLDWLLYRGPRPGGKLALGLGTGIAGIVLLVGPADLSGGHVDAVGAGALVFAAISWAIGSLYTRRASLPRAPLLSTGMEMLCGGVLLVVMGLLTGDGAALDIGQISARSLIAFGYLVVFGSLVGFTAYVWLLRNVPPAPASTYAYVNPVIALVLGWALADEPVSARTLVATAIIIGSVILITTSKADANQADPAPAPSPAPPEPVPILSGK